MLVLTMMDNGLPMLQVMVSRIISITMVIPEIIASYKMKEMGPWVVSLWGTREHGVGFDDELA